MDWHSFRMIAQARTNTWPILLTIRGCCLAECVTVSLGDWVALSEWLSVLLDCRHTAVTAVTPPIQQSQAHP